MNQGPALPVLNLEMLANKLHSLMVSINTASYGLWQVRVEQKAYSASSAMGAVTPDKRIGGQMEAANSYSSLV